MIYDSNSAAYYRSKEMKSTYLVYTDKLFFLCNQTLQPSCMTCPAADFDDGR
jgi:hypothetical protein